MVNRRILIIVSLLIACLVLLSYFAASSFPPLTKTIPSTEPLPSTNPPIENYEINQDTTLFLKDSPYEFSHDILVKPGAKLTLEAGVKIQFESNVSLIVYGSLFAVGTEKNKITFNSTDPSVFWGTIVFLGNNSESLIIEHAEITNADSGITINNEYGNATIENSNIHHNRVTGIQFNCRGNIAIRNSNISHNTNGVVGTGYAVRESSSDPYSYSARLRNIQLISNTIQNNVGQGVQLSAGGKIVAQITDLSFASNTISDNGENGVQIITNSGTDNIVSNVNFTSNTVTNNGGQGIQLFSASTGSEINSFYNISFSFNIISGNGGAGVHLNAPKHLEASQYDSEFTNNTFIGNNREAISVEGAVTSNITANIIRQSLYGVFYDRTQNNIAKFNNIANNTYGMFVSIGASVEAQNNYWGDPTGPFHLTINSDGKGNSVNGDGEDLKFIPFLLNAPEVTR